MWVTLSVRPIANEEELKRELRKSRGEILNFVGVGDGVCSRFAVFSSYFLPFRRSCRFVSFLELLLFPFSPFLFFALSFPLFRL